MKAISVRSIRKYIDHQGIEASMYRDALERMRRELAGTHKVEAIHLTWQCRNEFCRQWTMNGAYLKGVCNFCQTPRLTSKPKVT